MASRKAVRVALLWHMHQPDYRVPHSNRLAMPWVRLHALKDYLDMPLAAAANADIRVTFNLVPSLIDQLQLYLDGGTDRHLELSQLEAASLDSNQRAEMLETFFTGNPSRMIGPHARFNELYQKYRSAAANPGAMVSLFSTSEIRDLQVWSNLAWVDPAFREEEPIKSLFARGRHFTEEDKEALLRWQLDLIARIIPTYRQLQDEGRIEISFTPYYHPILPLLCDTDSARVALPSLKLPRKRFAHPEDARAQISKSVALYEGLFGRKLRGMWPSEGSVSPEAARLIAEQGVGWIATDEEVLAQSLEMAKLPPAQNPPHHLYQFEGLKLFFRDHALSDRIGFVYSGWPAERAVADFVGHIKRLGELYADEIDEVVIPIILDGENAWEYFEDDATEFLALLYKTLAEDEAIETVTCSEAVEVIKARDLPQLFSGSWINHNFRIWIGHDEDNAAWDLLGRARDDLVKFEADHPNIDPASREMAWEQIYIAEGSDWCWWYGDDHRGPHNAEFDRIFRQHLAAMYEVLKLEVPVEFLQPIHTETGSICTSMPDALVTPNLDGRLTHFYEWAGAGSFDCRASGNAMHMVDHVIESIHFAYDHARFYIRLDFDQKKTVDFSEEMKVQVTFYCPEKRRVEFGLSETGGTRPSEYGFARDTVLEIAVERAFLWPAANGELGFAVALIEDGRQLERWPGHESIKVTVPQPHRELFWPT